MAKSKITVIGFYNYYRATKRDLFELLQVPPDINRQQLINNILLKCDDFEVLYSDPDFMHDVIGVWSAKWQPTFMKWSKALNIEYNPLDNYDRTEEWTTTDDGTTSDNKHESNVHNLHTEDSSETHGTSGNKTESSGDAENTSKISAYNSNNFVNDTNSNSEQSSTIESNGSSDTTFSDSINTNESCSSDLSANGTSKNINIKHGRAHGNIGVTTSQQMLQAELEIARFNLIDQITDIFLKEFIIPVY